MVKRRTFCSACCWPSFLERPRPECICTRPGTNLEQSELAQLETATRSGDVAMYSFTDRYLAEELAAVARKGVRVRVYRDREQFQQEAQRGGPTTTAILLAAGS